MTSLPAPPTADRRALNQHVETVRAFNRFYTRQIGVLGDGYLGSPFSLAQVRVLYELAHREKPPAAEIAKELGLDPGYLSRILRGFERSGLIRKTPSVRDGRQRLLSLTPQGRAAIAPLEAASRDQIAAMLGELPPAAQRRLTGAMDQIAEILGQRIKSSEPYLLRPPQPGDLGWVVHRHGVLYAEEYGWDETFEALVAEIVASFVRAYDPKRERCWIAEREGENVGSVLLVAHPERAASPSCDCCWLSRPRAGSASGAVSSPRASASRGRPATTPSPSGPTTSSSPPATSTRPPASTSSLKNRTTASATISSVRRGS
jgi:DNA-binding MarR family transcriptional regulator